MKKHIVFVLTVCMLTLIAGCNTKPSKPDEAIQKNRIAKVIVDPLQLDSYNAFLREEIEASMDLESGVVLLYAVSAKEHPNHITILEIYVDESAYQSHIKTPHFIKYKEGTLDMVQNLELIEVDALLPDLITKQTK